MEVIEAIINATEQWVADYGYMAIFVLMLLESACIPIPSEATMLVGGWLAADGSLRFFWVGVAGVVGNVVGSWLAYVLGRWKGREFLEKYGKYVLIRAHDIDRAEKWWDKHGEAATFFSRLLPVIRTFISVPAGIAKMNFTKFTIYTVLGVIPWTFGLTWLGVVVQENWREVEGYFSVPAMIIAALLVVAALVWYLRRRARLKSQA